MGQWFCYFKKATTDDAPSLSSPQSSPTTISAKSITPPQSPVPTILPRLKVVLDMDGTLISIVKNDGFALHNVKLRPGVKELFEWAHQNKISMSIFTAASESWFCAVYGRLFIEVMPPGFNFEFIYTRLHCTYNPHTRSHIKLLQRVWDNEPDWTNTNTLIVDDIPSTFISNIRNGVLVDTFIADGSHDDTVFRLVQFLDTQKHSPDCRHPEYCHIV